MNTITSMPVTTFAIKTKPLATTEPEPAKPLSPSTKPTGTFNLNPILYNTTQERSLLAIGLGYHCADAEFYKIPTNNYPFIFGANVALGAYPTQPITNLQKALSGGISLLAGINILSYNEPNERAKTNIFAHFDLLGQAALIYNSSYSSNSVGSYAGGKAVWDVGLANVFTARLCLGLIWLVIPTNAPKLLQEGSLRISLPLTPWLDLYGGLGTNTGAMTGLFGIGITKTY